MTGTTRDVRREPSRELKHARPGRPPKSTPALRSTPAISTTATTFRRKFWLGRTGWPSESRQAVEVLHDLGVRVVTITGDARQVADAVGRELGIDESSPRSCPRTTTGPWPTSSAEAPGWPWWATA